MLRTSCRAASSPSSPAALATSPRCSVAYVSVNFLRIHRGAFSHTILTNPAFLSFSNTPLSLSTTSFKRTGSGKALASAAYAPPRIMRESKGGEYRGVGRAEPVEMSWMSVSFLSASSWSAAGVPAPPVGTACPPPPPPTPPPPKPARPSPNPKEPDPDPEHGVHTAISKADAAASQRWSPASAMPAV